uniref:Uncharacterized protein n=1 Tax=Anguilla anguilla TaxID=7936 RepID=A0A0E9UX09_ANGAN
MHAKELFTKKLRPKRLYFIFLTFENQIFCY